MIPTESGHSIRAKVATDSGRRRPPLLMRRIGAVVGLSEASSLAFCVQERSDARGEIADAKG